MDFDPWTNINKYTFMSYFADGFRVFHLFYSLLAKSENHMLQFA